MRRGSNHRGRTSSLLHKQNNFSFPCTQNLLNSYELFLFIDKLVDSFLKCSFNWQVRQERSSEICASRKEFNQARPWEDTKISRNNMTMIGINKQWVTVNITITLQNFLHFWGTNRPSHIPMAEKLLTRVLKYFQAIKRGHQNFLTIEGRQSKTLGRFKMEGPRTQFHYLKSNSKATNLVNIINSWSLVPQRQHPHNILVAHATSIVAHLENRNPIFLGIFKDCHLCHRNIEAAHRILTFHHT